MVRGTAPEMTPDLRQVIDGVESALPDVAWKQLTVKWPADDDGLWFFSRQGRQVQIESSSGMCPFVIESDQDAERRSGLTPAETIVTVVSLLQTPP